MRILIEFGWFVAEKVGKRYMWLEIDNITEIRLEDLFQKILPSSIGEELSKVLYQLFLQRDIFVVINGVIEVSPNKLIKDGDKIIIQPMASGG
ncbi:MAG: hypothetical protein QXT53_05675 [Ignisphaera sp.]